MHQNEAVSIGKKMQYIQSLGSDTYAKVFISESTVSRTRNQMWEQNLLRMALAENDPHLTIGMDGKKVKMGFNQGGEVVEHLVVNAQGVSGPRSLGVFQVADSKGKLEID